LVTFVEAAALNHSTECSGNPRWMAPELLDCEVDFKRTPATDIYSLAMLFFEVSSDPHVLRSGYDILFQVLTQRVPFSEFSRESAVISKVVMGHRPSLQPLASGILLDMAVDDLEDILKTCWQQTSDLRPSCTEVLLFLREVQATSKIWQEVNTWKYINPVAPLLADSKLHGLWNTRMTLLQRGGRLHSEDIYFLLKILDSVERASDCSLRTLDLSILPSHLDQFLSRHVSIPLWVGRARVVKHMLSKVTTPSDPACQITQGEDRYTNLEIGAENTLPFDQNQERFGDYIRVPLEHKSSLSVLFPVSDSSTLATTEINSETWMTLVMSKDPEDLKQVCQALYDMSLENGQHRSVDRTISRWKGTSALEVIHSICCEIVSRFSGT
jgi:serine/threonine protein kinase